MGNMISDPVLTKLLAVDSDLETQEAKLIARLNTIQVQRASLQSVLEIFSSDETKAAETATDRAVAAASPQIADVTADSSVEEPAKTSPRQQAAMTKDKSPRLHKASSGRSKLLRRGWQKYMRNEFSQTPLPAVVSGILQAQPQRIFEIAEVVDTIVVKAIPHTERKGARNRISNILAEGARKKQWHRHESGCYSFSK